MQNGERGATILKNEQWYIIFNDTESVPVCRFTVAHEIGHILLGHILVSGTKYRTFSKRDEEEQEADMFAARLLAPACVLHELQALSAEQIAKVCNISISAAEVRSERMQVLEARNKYYLHPLERRVREQFADYIKENKQ